MVNQEVVDLNSSLGEPWQVELCSCLRQLVWEAVPEVEESIQYRMPHFLKNKKYTAVISPAKQHIGFTIFNAAELERVNEY